MKPLTFSILRLLSDNEFHSGEIIARAMGVSRASISIALNDVNETGLTLQKVHGRGYRLLGPVQWLERDTVLKHLGGEANRFNLEMLDIIDSTSSYLLQRAARGSGAGSEHIHVVAAELQTSGRGRRGRRWYSGLGDGLAFSLLWRFQHGASLLAGLSLVIGLAIIRTLESAGVEGAVLKWPNDVLYNMCKLAGILIELHGDMLGPTMAVIGVGLNLKLSNVTHARIDQGVTDVYSISGETPDRNRFLAALLMSLTSALRDFEREGFSLFKQEWLAHHCCENKVVRLGFPDGSSLEGVIHGVADDGSLLLRTFAGVQRFNSGEITLYKME
ncbi:biotin--[acetyl-CoA-carboxylase] ligase [Nitrosospira sp. Is2]|uniref:biotin--[acetyl-CoA-carboxylase] ligase n=1 Tax=Nitrosospira sp. Is2 TaxID=3080532 RepID=UPI002955DF0D|nr:biotin--[acetyl-CoA-carboxylase] ligase [Nitrosospira sp. Is2]WON74564.1 biotin--[acetyl-CoA-carboxylase] ligase [Nitrosospira sp. Is2]